MNATTAVGYVCVAAVLMFGMSRCGTRVNPEEVKAVAEACAKVGKQPDISISPSAIKMGCKENTK